jgi:hypothetical protein
MRAPVIAFASLLLAAPAAASPGVPAEIAAHLGAPTPPCSICHQGTPGLGTATTTFAEALKARGLVPGNLTSLDTALDALAAENHDSNGNGINDIDELRAGNDPNATTSGSSVVPTYGCIGSVARERPGAGSGHVALLAALLVLVAVRRRRRSS